MYRKSHYQLNEEFRKQLREHAAVPSWIWLLIIAAVWVVCFFFGIAIIAQTAVSTSTTFKLQTAVGIPTFVVVILVMWVTGGNPVRALLKWGRNNVTGFVAEFKLDESGELQMEILRRGTYVFSPRNPESYYVALGGWFFRASKKIGPWKLNRYESNIFVWAGHEDDGALFVFVEDYAGTRVKLPLATALSFVKVAEAADWRNSWDRALCDLFLKRKQREFAITAIDEAIDMLLRSARYGKSKEAREVRIHLEEGLALGAPELVRERFVREPAKASAAA
jgi:hypothetical protein